MIAAADGKPGFQIALDGRLLKTPAKSPLVLPSKALALAIAAEYVLSELAEEATCDQQPVLSLCFPGGSTKTRSTSGPLPCR